VPSRNSQIIEALRELAELTILDEGSAQSFRARAYEMAALELEGVRGEIAELSQRELTAIEGIGKSLAAKIRALADTGRIEKLEELRAKYPPSYRELTRVPGIGPKTAARLRLELGVESVGDLRLAIDQQRVRALPRMGEKTEAKLARAIERAGSFGKSHRAPIADALPIAERLVGSLEALDEVERVQYCGSLRRFRETVADIDLIAASSAPAAVMEAFCGAPEVSEVIARGDTKSSIVTARGLQVDLRVVSRDQYGAAILYFTGSKAHNIKLRQLALRRGWTLNEYGLTELDTGRVIASESEEAIYEALDLPLIAPPMREDTGEVERAADGSLPARLTPEDLRGDLHVHTDRSGDARSPLEEVVAAAAARGYAYLAITDHGENLAANGVSRAELEAQRRELEALRPRYPALTILQGCELNIGPRGELDYDDGFRRGLDFCIAGVHSHFELDAEAQTRRVIAAMEDPSVRAIAHLTGRRVELDVRAVLEAAARTGTAIEINSSLARLDAPADILRLAGELGVRFTLSSDAHRASGLAASRFGVELATRGWVSPDQVVNTWPRAEFLRWAAG
jgi:DNA polymerase (family X)